ncbi:MULTISPECIES: ferredoxin [Rhodococcus]|uniref:ferredoxin n=1 Tax=Rhodococcus TaxID=1827 RepID=UPI0022356D7E|nr:MULTISPECIES: ferredoxin [Rhodococcus]MDI9977275.1 ferredoxin [Rhodococcus sp. IEGM 1307]UZG55136.1 ferredoxin [Rhodococcus opacus]
MRITIDPDKCCGYGDCVLAAPDIFELGTDNVAHVLDAEPGPGLRDAAVEAAAACPVAAIEIG